MNYPSMFPVSIFMKILYELLVKVSSITFMKTLYELLVVKVSSINFYENSF